MGIIRTTPAQSSGAPITYTNSVSDLTTTLATAVALFTAAQNTNGAYIEKLDIIHSANSDQMVNFLAKETAPTAAGDGDVIARVGANTVNVLVKETLIGRIKIPAGKGFYKYITGGGISTISAASVLFTLM